jgi:hypothetical protein
MRNVDTAECLMILQQSRSLIECKFRCRSQAGSKPTPVALAIVVPNLRLLALERFSGINADSLFKLLTAIASHSQIGSGPGD